MNDWVRETLLDEMEPQQVADIAGQLETDDAVALIEDLDRDGRAVRQRLHGEGLVVIEPNRGAHVRPLYHGFIEDLFAVGVSEEQIAHLTDLASTVMDQMELRLSARRASRMRCARPLA